MNTTNTTTVPYVSHGGCMFLSSTEDYSADELEEILQGDAMVIQAGYPCDLAVKELHAMGHHIEEIKEVFGDDYPQAEGYTFTPELGYIKDES